MWEEACGNVKGIIKASYERRFTLFGRVEFLKSFVLSKVIHLAQVIPCNDRITDHFLSLFTNFIWARRIERPSREAAHRQTRQGGLGVPHPTLFFRSLYIRTLLKSFIGPEGSEKTLLHYWLGFPLRHVFRDYDRNKPAAIIDRPASMNFAIQHVSDLLKNKIATPDFIPSHKLIYQRWAAAIGGPGHVEKLKPDLDWVGIWKWVSSLKNEIRDNVFLFNHRLLLTRARLLRLR